MNNKYLSVAVAITFLSLAPLPALADDTVVFTADESDLQAFDHLLSEQKQAQDQKQPAPPNGKTPFGQAVRVEAQKLNQERPEGNAMGAWVSGQRRQSGASSKGLDDSASGSPGSAGQQKAAEMRGLVSGSSGKGSEKGTKAHGRP
jgi:hypothetical protein